MSGIPECPSIARRSSSFLAKVGATMRVALERRQRYVAARNLSRLSDYMLKDMGVTRGEIPTAVDGLLRRGREDDAE
jgi:uncharacterized protein YjiS (DUF1127 family)